MADGRKSIKDKMRIAVLTERIDVAGPEVAIFKFRPKEGELFSFAAGQYATLGLDVGDELVPRAYSIASSPYARDHLEFYINEIEEGQLTPSLFRLRIGDHVHYMGPKGIFTLARTEAKHLLLIATGTGLAPYVSMLRTLRLEQWAGRPHKRTITLVHGARQTADLGYRWELDGLARQPDFNLLYLPMVSRPQGDSFWRATAGRGRVTELLKVLGAGRPGEGPSPLPEGVDLAAVAARCPPGETAVFLCGNPGMISDAKALLHEQRYDDIYTEEYW
jgi:ferredoxin--NADP+ reductase